MCNGRILCSSYKRKIPDRLCKKNLQKLTYKNSRIYEGLQQIYRFHIRVISHTPFDSRRAVNICQVTKSEFKNGADR